MLSRRRAAAVLAAVGCSIALSGCGGCALGRLNRFLNPAGQFPGARLVVPPTATAGDTITLDATGSEIRAPAVVCPEAVRFYVFDARVRSASALEARPLAMIGQPRTEFVDARGQRVGTPADAASCRLTDGRVQVKVPAGLQPGVAELAVGVVVEALPGETSGPNAVPPVQSNEVARLRVTTPAGVTARPPATTPAAGGPAPAPAANQLPVARFFAIVDPAVQGDPIGIDARESFDRDGTITRYDFDFNGDGVYEEISNDASGTLQNAGPPGTRRIVVRVHDNEGATATAQLDLLVVAPTTFTSGTFGSPAEVAVDAPFDVSVNNSVPGANFIALDTDGDDVFDDGLPTAQKAPGDAQPQFTGMRYGTGGWKRVRVLWYDAAPTPTQETVSTQLIRVKPFVNPTARIASVGGTAAQAGTRLTATLRLRRAAPVTVGRISLVREGLAVRGLVVRGRLRGAVRSRDAGRRAPEALRVLRDAVFAGSFTGTVPTTPLGPGTPTGTGVLLARAPADRRTQVCLRVTQRSATSTRFTVLGATGRARGLRASGAFPALRLDPVSLRAAAQRVPVTVGRGQARPLPGACRALAPHLSGRSR